MKNLTTLLVLAISFVTLTSCDPTALTGGTGVNGREFVSTEPVQYGVWTDGTISGDGSYNWYTLWKCVTDQGRTVLIKHNEDKSSLRTDIARSRFDQAVITYSTEPLTISVNGFSQQNSFYVYAGSNPRNR